MLNTKLIDIECKVNKFIKAGVSRTNLSFFIKFVIPDGIINYDEVLLLLEKEFRNFEELVVDLNLYIIIDLTIDKFVIKNLFEFNDLFNKGIRSFIKNTFTLKFNITFNNIKDLDLISFIRSVRTISSYAYSITFDSCDLNLSLLSRDINIIKNECSILEYIDFIDCSFRQDKDYKIEQSDFNYSFLINVSIDNCKFYLEDNILFIDLPCKQLDLSFKVELINNSFEEYNYLDLIISSRIGKFERLTINYLESYYYRNNSSPDHFDLQLNGTCDNLELYNFNSLDSLDFIYQVNKLLNIKNCLINYDIDLLKSPFSIELVYFDTVTFSKLPIEFINRLIELSPNITLLSLNNININTLPVIQENSSLKYISLFLNKINYEELSEDIIDLYLRSEILIGLSIYEDQNLTNISSLFESNQVNLVQYMNGNQRIVSCYFHSIQYITKKLLPILLSELLKPFKDWDINWLMQSYEHLVSCDLMTADHFNIYIQILLSLDRHSFNNFIQQAFYNHYVKLLSIDNNKESVFINKRQYKQGLYGLEISSKEYLFPTLINLFFNRFNCLLLICPSTKEPSFIPISNTFRDFNTALAWINRGMTSKDLIAQS